MCDRALVYSVDLYRYRLHQACAFLLVRLSWIMFPNLTLLLTCGNPNPSYCSWSDICVQLSYDRHGVSNYTLTIFIWLKVIGSISRSSSISDVCHNRNITYWWFRPIYFNAKWPTEQDICCHKRSMRRYGLFKTWGICCQTYWGMFLCLWVYVGKE